MKMQNLKKREKNKSRVSLYPVKRAEMEARAIELKELEERKRAIIIASAKEEEAALDEKMTALKKTIMCSML